MPTENNFKIGREILEGNKLIMFFDGAESTTIDVMGQICPSIKYKDSYYPPDRNLPLFHEDWNLLMPIYNNFRCMVVDESIFNKRQEHCQLIRQEITGVNIRGAHDRLVEAITWYNNQSKQKQ